MTTLLAPPIVRAGGKPPPRDYEADAPSPPEETDEHESEREA